ncbi:MAG TPA: phosphoribosyl-AMP cyclohydrolase [Candidatus Norongarragalinales archaeon]|nr:phosphoribosyl-AMP cyclohydrolase [Candidatus Norongarragalinales archaeon]
MKLWPVVVQDAGTKDVLMLAYANEDALKRTRKTKWAWFYSRSRKSLWKKGESSGNTLRVKKITWDCDRDALLYRVFSIGPSCHTGEATCFGPKAFGLELLVQRLAERRNRKDSYTAKLLNQPMLLAQKLAEEGAELGEARTRKQVVWEAADLLYFTFVKLLEKNVPLERVIRELERRAFEKG